MNKYETKFTPGPWEYELDEGCEFVVNIYSQDSELGYKGLFEPIMEMGDQTEGIANAKLVSAAPDMFRMLAKLLDEDVNKGTDTYREAEKLLEKIINLDDYHE